MSGNQHYVGTEVAPVNKKKLLSCGLKCCKRSAERSESGLQETGRQGSPTIRFSAARALSGACWVYVANIFCKAVTSKPATQNSVAEYS